MRCRCGSSDIDHDASRGSAVCRVCGQVLEENTIISEVTFADSAGGQSSVVGKFVRATGSRAVSGGLAGFGKESRDITISNGRGRIKELAAGLHLNQHHEDFAVRLFTLAVQHNFVQGRKTENVCAACLYIVCRREKTPHLLIDFSDLLQTNVFPLGQTFLKLVRLLNITVPLIDPSLYIHRFASKLEFEDETHPVAMTAVRLVGRMSRDWIQTGRRPAGICGACLLIAARMHNFRRTQQQVIKVVHICDATLRNRLDDFAKTPASALTKAQFESRELDNIPASDPPAYTRSIAAATAAQLEDQGQRSQQPMLLHDAGPNSLNASQLERAAEEAAKMAVEMFPKDVSAVEKARGTKPVATVKAKRIAGRKKLAAAAITDRRGNKADSMQSDENETVPTSPAQTVRDCLHGIEETTKRINILSDDQLRLLCRQMQIATGGQRASKLKRALTLAEAFPNTARWSLARLEANMRPPEPALWKSSVSTTTDGQLAANFTTDKRVDIRSDGTNLDGSASQNHAQLRQPLASQTDATSGDVNVSTKDSASSGSGGGGGRKSGVMIRLPEIELDGSEDENLSDCDDDIDSYLVTDKAEVEAKTKIWMSMNKEYLEAQREKLRRLGEDIAAGRVTAPRKRRRRGEQQEPGSAAEAAMKVLQEKKVSAKVNYSVLQNLFTKPGEEDSNGESSKSSEPEQKKTDLLISADRELAADTSTATSLSAVTHESPSSRKDASLPARFPEKEEEEEEEDDAKSEDEEDPGIYGQDVEGAESDDDDFM